MSFRTFVPMKRFFLCFCWGLLMTLTGYAQETNLLRDSLKTVTELVGYYPDSIDLRLQKAALNMQLEQWEYAKDEYDYVIKLQPENLTAHFYRAYANERLFRYRFARFDYESVLTVAPANFEARLGLALLNYKDKRYQESMDQINILVQQHPDSAVAYAARAGMEKEREMYSLAEYDYSKAMSIDPLNTDYILARADVRIILGELNKAREDLDLLVSLGIPRSSLTAYYRKVRKRDKK